MEDDVPADVKQRRLAEIIALQGELSRKKNAILRWQNLRSFD